MTEAVLDRRTGNLPAEVTRFIGRRGDLADAKRLIETSRLVTLAGVSGVGKSRLALQIAADVRRSFDDGTWFVELSGLHDPDLLAHTVSDALHIPGRTAHDQIDVLVDHLEDKRLLLVLDTCEHLIDGCAMLAEVLLRAAPQLRIIATSREALDVPGEHLLLLAPLSVPDLDAGTIGIGDSDALALFLDRAAAVQPGFRIEAGNQQAVVRLCQRLDGIPLAIELAAGRLRAMSIDQIVARLDDRFRLLGSARTSLTRHQTLRAAVGWSHELCTPGERLLWERLSIFVGGFEAEAAEHVCSDEDLPAEAVFDTLARLVEKSIVAREPDGQRYRMLDTLREYGEERLHALGRHDDLARRHCEWFTGLTRESEAAVLSEQQLDWFARLERDHVNLRAALDFSLSTPGEALTGIRLAAGLWSFWLTHGFFSEGRHWLSRALASYSEPTADRARALYVAGMLAVMQGDTSAAAVIQEEAMALARGLDDPRVTAYTAQLAGVSAMFKNDLGHARELLEESLAQQGETGRAELFSLVNYPMLAAICCLEGDLDQAIALSEEGLRLSGESGERWCHSYALYVRGLARAMKGDIGIAADDGRAALRMKWEIGDRMGVAMAVDLVGGIAMALGDAERAARLFGAAEHMWLTLGSPMFGEGYKAIKVQYSGLARKMLGEDAHAAACQAGARMKADEAVAYALGEVAGTDPLTRREREISELVAEGLSNREIAERLVIAKRTVDSHLEHILAKLGFTSRTQIAAWVTSHQVSRET